MSENIGVSTNWGMCSYHGRLRVTPPYDPLPSLGIGYRLDGRREAGKILGIVCFFPLSDQPQGFGFWSDRWACFHFVGLRVFDYVIIPLS